MGNYLDRVAGKLKQIAGITSSAGAGDDGKIIALDSAGKLDSSFMPAGVGADTTSILASEGLAAGDLVNIYDNAGTANCRKADATTAGKEADGFVLAVVTSGANATVYPVGSSNTQVTGLTAGTQYLSTTAGGMSITPPSASGNIVQEVGSASSATAMVFTRGDSTELV